VQVDELDIKGTNKVGDSGVVNEVSAALGKN
jgi:hypothetical protein